MDRQGAWGGEGRRERRPPPPPYIDGESAAEEEPSSWGVEAVARERQGGAVREVGHVRCHPGSV